MFEPFNHEDTDLDKAIAKTFQDYMSCNPDADGYQTTVDQLTKLYAIKNQSAQLNFQAQTEAVTQRRANADSQWEAELAERPFWKRVEPNTAVTVAGNLILGLLVIKYEQTGVISSKVMTFMKKI